jgi:hypothetical protein
MCPAQPTLFIGLGFCRLYFYRYYFPSAATSLPPPVFRTAMGLKVGGSTATAQFHDDDSVMRFHSDGLVLGGRFHDDVLDLDDGSVEGGRFHGDGLDPTNVKVRHHHPSPTMLEFHCRCHDVWIPLPPWWAFPPCRLRWGGSMTDWWWQLQQRRWRL